MKKIFIILFQFIVFHLFSAVKDTMECTYFLTKADFIANANGKKEHFIFNQRSDIEDKTGVQEEFRIRWLKRELKTKIINKSIFAIISPNDTLINTYHFDESLGYSKLYKVDSFLIIYSYKKAQDMAATGAIWMGLVGAFITSSIAESKGAEAYIFSPNSDKKMPLTKSNVLHHLKSLNNNEVVKNFKEEEGYDLNVLMTYFKYYILCKYGTKN